VENPPSLLMTGGCHSSSFVSHISAHTHAKLILTQLVAPSCHIKTSLHAYIQHSIYIKTCVPFFSLTYEHKKDMTALALASTISPPYPIYMSPLYAKHYIYIGGKWIRKHYIIEACVRLHSKHFDATSAVYEPWCWLLRGLKLLVYEALSYWCTHADAWMQ
jgi:hypothetical protein